MAFFFFGDQGIEKKGLELWEKTPEDFSKGGPRKNFLLFFLFFFVFLFVCFFGGVEVLPPPFTNPRRTALKRALKTCRESLPFYMGQKSRLQLITPS